MRFAHLRRVLLVAAVAGGIAAVVLWQARPPRDGSLDEAVGALRRDDAGAAARVRRIARREGAACLPAVQAMLDDPDWRLRAAACAVLGDQADRPSLAPLVSRCSDVDWRVRAAAAEALSRWRPLPARQTLRDVPIDQRDRALLEWMETLDGDDRLSERLCDLYAGARHVEFSRTLADRCLTCHAGPYPRPQTPGGDCGACHGEIHRQWAASAHANSLTHLSLPTPVDGGLAPLDFGDLGGLDCTACHRAAAAEATGGCPYVFDDLSVDAVCQRCHAPTVRQWRRWREGPQPRRAPWPPGHLEVRTGLDRRDCADCHMAPDGGIPAHHWQARRDPALLAGGVALRVAQQPPGPDGAVVRLT
ncbi:MAG: HEAT repeat domain-containing protein, partial [Planctomycetes bacterium]|nr:HEAT repeat domain-containing protein [Planctomycetota bacterium]